VVIKAFAALKKKFGAGASVQCPWISTEVDHWVRRLKKKLLICYRGSCADHFCPWKWEPPQLGIEEITARVHFLEEIVYIIILFEFCYFERVFEYSLSGNFQFNSIIYIKSLRRRGFMLDRTGLAPAVCFLSVLHYRYRIYRPFIYFLSVF